MSTTVILRLCKHLELSIPQLEGVKDMSFIIIGRETFRSIPPIQVFNLTVYHEGRLLFFFASVPGVLIKFPFLVLKHLRDIIQLNLEQKTEPDCRGRSAGYYNVATNKFP